MYVIYVCDVDEVGVCDVDGVDEDCVCDVCGLAGVDINIRMYVVKC